MAKRTKEEIETGEANEQIADDVEDGTDTELLVLVDGSELTVPVGFKGRSKRAQCIFLKEEYGLATVQIAKGLGVRYQQVYQALKKVTPEATGGTRCKVCGRVLTAAQSLAQQVGPICAERLPSETDPNVGKGWDESSSDASEELEAGEVPF